MSEQQAYAREESYAERHNQRIRELEARIQKAREILHRERWSGDPLATIEHALEALEGK